MILLHAADIIQLPPDTPQAIKEKIREQLETLDNLYGSDRGIDNDGGYIVYVSKDEDCEQVLDAANIDLDETIVEYVDLIPTDKGDFLSALYLFNNEFGVSVFIKKDNAPMSLLEEI